jgi:hypothetical protein
LFLAPTFAKEYAMKRWFRRIAIAAALILVVVGVWFESATRVGRGWLTGEPFYDGRPASYWANEIERWETQDPDWETQRYVRRPTSPPWIERRLPAPRWPLLLDGDPNGLAVLQALRNNPSPEVQDWAKIGIERIANDERGPIKIKHPSVIMTAELYEVDEAFFQELAKAKWHSQADYEEMERIVLDHPERAQTGPSLFELIRKQKLLLAAKETKSELNQERVLLSLTRESTCLPSPAQLRKGQNDAQKIDEGVALRAQAEVSADLRFLRVTFIEKSWELEGIDKVAVVLDEKGTETVAEIASVKETTVSMLRTIPDGGTLLLPLQSRPPHVREKGRFLVAVIAPRIYIEAEERQRQGQPAK